MRMFTVKQGTDIEVKPVESDHFLMVRAMQDMNFFREDIYVDPVNNLTQMPDAEDIELAGDYVFRADGMDVKVHMSQVEVM